MRINKIRKILFCFIAIFLLTGCWDKVEIDDRAFVLSLGIDKFVYNESQHKTELNQPYNRYQITYVIPNLQKLTGNPGVSEEPKFVKTSVNKTLFSTGKYLGTRLQQVLYFGHTKSILFGSDLLKDPVLLKEALDALERNSEFGRSIPVIAVDGTAEEALLTVPDMQPLIGIYIMKLFDNNTKEVAALYKETLGQLLLSLHKNNTGIIPKMTIGEKDIKIAGSALIKNYQFQNWIGEKETRAIMWQRGKAEGTEISISYEDFYVSYNVSNITSKITFDDQLDPIHCNIKIEMEGDITEYTLEAEKALFNETTIKDIEKELEKKIKEEVLQANKKTQMEYKADIIGIGEKLYKQKPQLWEKVKRNWEEEYENITFSVEPVVHIRRIGLTK